MEERDALLQQRHQLAGLDGARDAVRAEQPRGAVDVEDVLAAPARELGERRGEAFDEGALAHAELRVGEAAEQHAGAEREAADALAEVLAGPGDEPCVDGIVERADELRDAARRGDDHDQDDARLECQHLDVADRGGIERGSGRDREQVRDLRERLGRHAECLVELAADLREVERREAARLVGVGEQLVDQVAVTGHCGGAAGRGVRVREEALRLELGELVADRRGSPFELGGERAGAHGLAGRHVARGDLAQDFFLTGSQH